MNTIFGYKYQMSQTWDKNGKRLPVTKVRVPSLTISQVKTIDTDGYNATQIAIGQLRTQATKPLRTHLHKANIEQRPKAIREIKLDNQAEKQAGDTLKINDVLQVGSLVNVSGVSRGRGFAGVVKRWGFSGGPRTHGQSDRERAPGSIGQGTTPGRVYKGKRMPGHMGVQRFTIKNLTVLHIDEASGEVWVSGPIPGSPNSLVEISFKGETKFPGLYYEIAQTIEAETTLSQIESDAVEAEKAVESVEATEPAKETEPVATN